jgi:hypothetical protein
MSRSIATVLSVKIIEARALLAMGVGIGFLSVLSVFGCAATAPPSEHLATSRAVAVPQARTFQSGVVTTDIEGDSLTAAAPEIDPDCPYFTVRLVTPCMSDREAGTAWNELQEEYIKIFSVQLGRVGFQAWEPPWERLGRKGLAELGNFLTMRLSENVCSIMGALTEDDEAEFERLESKLTADEKAILVQTIGESAYPIGSARDRTWHTGLVTSFT